MRPVTHNPQPEAVIDPGRGRLSWTDRCRIDQLVTAHYTPAQIAGLMGRAGSTVTRELARGLPDSGSGRYRAVVAENRVDAARRRPKQRKPVPGSRLYCTTGFVWCCTCVTTTPPMPWPLR